MSLFRKITDSLGITKKEIVAPTMDLTSLMPPVYDQGQLGSCSSMGIAAAYEFEMMKQKEASFLPSRLFIYYNERSIEGDVDKDAGAFIHDGIKSIDTNGVCSEDTWPYDIEKFNVKPPDIAYSEGMRHTAVKCYSTDVDLDSIKDAIFSGYPVIVAINIYSNFDSDEAANTGTIKMPDKNETSEGGHCVLIVGYNDSKKQLIMRNSWGNTWGNKGYFTLPYDYVDSDYMSDLWVIQVVV